MTTVLLGGLGTTKRIWEQQLAAVDDALPIDLPGHGDAPLPAGRVTVERIARDVLARAPDRFAFVGVSIGGMVGQWLGANAPERLDKLVLACTGAKIGSREDYDARAELVRREGLEPVVAGARERWFTRTFRDDPRARLILEDLRHVDRRGYAACCDAVGDWDFRDDVRRIAVETLVIFGRDDPVTPAEVRDGLASFTTAEIPGAHLANVESAHAFNEQLRSFL
ncbi:MAG TPA: alpha/beta fold hydrolase [Gaiellaceae bacterium]|nr:alpha/beta fold hydrolase [Gaiellaceae bacterium]